MVKPVITTRTTKGSALTWTEGDTNLENLRDATITLKSSSGLTETDVIADLNGTISIVAGTNISLAGDNTAKTITINNTQTAGATTLDELIDVVITGASTGEVLQYNGTNWVDVAPSTLTVGTASIGSTVTLTADNSTNATNYPLFVNAATGNLSPRTDLGFTYNPSTGVLTATTFNGNATSATSSDTVTITTDNFGSSTGYVLFSNGTTPASPRADSSLTYLPSTGILTTTGFAGALNGTVGATTPSTGAFTTLSASTSVSFSPSGAITLNPTTAGTINNMSIGATTASTGRFTTITSTATTGTAPFTVASTTNVANLNASSLNGATFAAPGPIGSTTASTGAFTTLTAATTTLDDIRETFYGAGATGATTITPDAANGSIQSLTASGNFTFNAFANPVSGQTITFIIQQDGTGNRTMTSTMKFAGGVKTLSTAAAATDILTVTYLGAAGYFASLSKGFV